MPHSALVVQVIYWTVVHRHNWVVIACTQLYPPIPIMVNVVSSDLLVWSGLGGRAWVEMDKWMGCCV